MRLQEVLLIASLALPGCATTGSQANRPSCPEGSRLVGEEYVVSSDGEKSNVEACLDDKYKSIEKLRENCAQKALGVGVAVNQFGAASWICVPKNQ